MENIGKCYVINLKERTDRLAEFKQKVPADIKYEVFDAYSYKLINEYKDNYILKKFLNPLTEKFKFPVLCCFASHYDLWKEISNQDLSKYYIIYEDDTFFTDNYIQKLTNVLNDINDIQFDLLYLGSVFMKDFVPKSMNNFIKLKSNIYKYRETPFKPTDKFYIDIHRTSSSYMLTVDGAKNLIKCTEESNVIYPVDVFMFTRLNADKLLHVIPYINWSPYKYKSDVQT